MDEAESGRVADRPQFRKMLDAASGPNAPFEEILVWKFSRFTRKREHAVAFKSMLRRRGIRVVSITEHADDSPTGKLMEAIIESLDEFYSENLAQEVTRGMREAASRGFFLASRAPFGYRRIKVSDGAKERPTLEVDPATAPIVREMFESSLRGNGLKGICRDLNERGITNRGRRWYRNGLHYLLTNEAYTGTAVWGRTSKDGKQPEPVRAEGAWEAIVPRELLDKVQASLEERAPKRQRPARVGSKFLLSGLLRCGVCGKPYTGQGAKGGRYAYYVCGTLLKEGAGSCEARYLNAEKVEGFIVEKIRERILTNETITELVTLVAEEVDALAGQLGGELKAIEAELEDVQSQAAAALRGAGEERPHAGGAVAADSLAAAAGGPACGSTGGSSGPACVPEGGVAHDRGDQGVRGGLPELPAGRDDPGAKGPHPQLRARHRSSGRRGNAEVYDSHALGRRYQRGGAGSRFCPVRPTRLDCRQYRVAQGHFLHVPPPVGLSGGVGIV